MRTEWIETRDPFSMAQTAADWVTELAEASIAARGRFDLVLAGGDTPRLLYRRLADRCADFTGWHLWFGDERCLPAGDPQRNDSMVGESWIRHVTVPPQLHPIPVELGVEQAAIQYQAQLEPVARFDLVLLGLGEDGHTASLFPGYWHPHEQRSVVPVHQAPKPPAERVSLSSRRLSQSDEVLFLVAGESKRQAVTNWRCGADIPAAGIRAVRRMRVLFDHNAASY